MSRRITPSRLALARRLKGMSQTALAEAVHVTQGAINQFESGVTQPSVELIDRLAMNLKVSPTFLARPELPQEGRPFFRSLTRVPAGERDRAAAYAVTLRDVVNELDRYVTVPDIAISRIVHADATTSVDEIEAAAISARALWKIAPGAVPNLVAMAESRGVGVAAVGSFHDGIDAFTAAGPGRPVVVLCSNKGVATRRRFDMAHELAHLALHDQRAIEPSWQELQAHRFGSALLMPADEVSDMLPTRDDHLRAAEQVARTWGVSMQAALMRARDLGHLSTDDHQRAMRRLSRAGWRTREPVEVGPPEQPTMLQAAIAALPTTDMSLSKLAGELGLPLGRLSRMLSLPEAVSDGTGGDVIAFAPTPRH